MISLFQNVEKWLYNKTKCICDSDIDECLENGGKMGHHCHKDQLCVNTLGSYTCECKPGHSLQHDQSCSPISRGVFLGQTCLYTSSISVILTWLCLCLLEISHRWWRRVNTRTVRRVNTVLCEDKIHVQKQSKNRMVKIQCTVMSSSDQRVYRTSVNDILLKQLWNFVVMQRGILIIKGSAHLYAPVCSTRQEL